MKTYQIGNARLISATDHEFKRFFNETVTSNKGGLITFSSTHTIVLSHISKHLLDILNSAIANCPDGSPLTWGLTEKISTHRGSDCFRNALNDTSLRNVRMLVLGGAKDMSKHYTNSLGQLNKAVINLKYASLPKLDLFNLDLEEAVRRIQEYDPQVIWLSLGSPKQEIVSSELLKLFPTKLFINVGAALDFVSGTKKEAPMWMRGKSLEWLYRFTKEPRRLWRRYFFGNLSYILYFTAHKLAKKSITDFSVPEVS